MGVLYYDFENGTQKIYQRTLARLCGIPVSQIIAADLEADEKNRLESAQDELQKMLQFFRVVNDRHGTGMKAKLKDVVVAGKTGTAQNPTGKAHGWFSGFAPSENSKICVVVFVEFGGKGGLEASKIARGVFEKSIDLELL